MPFMLSPKWFALESRRSSAAPRAKDRRQQSSRLDRHAAGGAAVADDPDLDLGLGLGQQSGLRPGRGSQGHGCHQSARREHPDRRHGDVRQRDHRARDGAPGQWLGVAVDGVAGRDVLGDGHLWRHLHVRQQHEHDIRRLHLQPGRQRHLWEHRHRRRSWRRRRPSWPTPSAWRWAPTGPSTSPIPSTIRSTPSAPTRESSRSSRATAPPAMSMARPLSAEFAIPSRAGV